MIDFNSNRMAGWLEQAWLARYLDRELTGGETAWFEAYLLDKPHLAEAIDADENLRATVLGAPAMLLEEDAAVSPDAMPAPSKPPAPVWLAWAASFALGVGLTWFAAQNLSGDAQVVPSAPSRVIYDTLRGALVEPREEPGDPASPIRLYEVPLPAGSQLDAAFADVDGARVRLPNPPVSADGYITFALPSSWRHSATLHLKLKGTARPVPDLVLSL